MVGTTSFFSLLLLAVVGLSIVVTISRTVKKMIRSEQN